MGRNTGVRQNPDRLDRLIALRRDGKTLQEIGNAVGITAERVRQILAREENNNGHDRTEQVGRSVISDSRS